MANHNLAITKVGSACLQLENVVRWVLWLSRQDPSAKFLVFSSWKDVLSLVRAWSLSCVSGSSKH